LADKRVGPLSDLAAAEAKERAAACAASERQLGVLDVKLARLNASLADSMHERQTLTQLVQAQDDELTQLRIDRSSLQSKVASCEAELQGTNRTIARLRSEIDAVIQGAGVKFEASVAVKERHIFELQAQLKEAQRDVKASQQDMTEVIRTLQLCEQRKGAAAAAAAGGAGAAATGDAAAALASVDALGFCAGDGSERGRWVKGIYVPQGCQFHEYGELEARQCLRDQRVLMYGDLALKDLAYALFALLNKEAIDTATDGAGVAAAELPKQYSKAAFCRPTDREGALPGCEFRVADAGIAVEWYNEPHYHSPLLKTTIGELKQMLPDVVVAGSGTEHILRQRPQWKQRLFEELPLVLDWLAKKLKPAGAQFYWRTNPALPNADPETNALLQQADSVVRPMVELYGFKPVHVAPSTRAPGAAALAQLPNTATTPLTNVQLQMWLNRHCNEKLKVKATDAE
jgi:hypothetical protein